MTTKLPTTADRDLQALLQQKASLANDDNLLLPVVLKTVVETEEDEVPEAETVATGGDPAAVGEAATTTTSASASEASSSAPTTSSDHVGASQVTDDSEAAVDATSDAGAAAAAQAASDSNTIGISNAGAGIRLAAHDLSIFRVHCRCAECLKYRETLIQLFLEDFEYNTLWKRLQLLVRRFYDLVPENADIHTLVADEESNVPAAPTLPEEPAAAVVASTSAALCSSSESAANAVYTADKSVGHKWVCDGRQLDAKKNIQLSLSANLPLNNDMTFIMVFSMLYRRDPHQLFELLSMQLRSIATLYSNMFKNKLMKYTESMGAAKKAASVKAPASKHNVEAEELVNFVLDGYDKMCNAARILSPLLFELQRGHMQQFSLTWNLLNKRIYQRWVYWSVKDLIPGCILKLRSTLPPSRYRCMVYRFIKFDDEMTLVTYKWRDIWTSLNIYHLGAADRRRRERIRIVHSMLQSIRRTTFAVPHSADHYDNGRQQTAAWLSGIDRNAAWAYTVHYLRTHWEECRDPRLLAGLTGIQCLKCDRTPATHFVDCMCRSCILAGGPNTCRIKDPNREFFCTRCTKFETINRDYLHSVTEFLEAGDEAADGSSKTLAAARAKRAAAAAARQPVWEEWLQQHSYHLAWAVFQHLPHRRPYVAPELDVQHFCTFQQPPCQRNDCRVATQIISGLYPMNFSKFLITTYEPVHEDDSKGMMHFHLAFLLRKLCAENGQVAAGGSPLPSTSNGVGTAGGHVSLTELLHDVDESDSAMLCKIGSAFTDCYLTEHAAPVAELLKECFVLRPGVDIELNVLWLEVMYTEQDEEVLAAQQQQHAANCTLHRHKQEQPHQQQPATSSGESGGDAAGSSSSKRTLTPSSAATAAPADAAASKPAAAACSMEEVSGRVRELHQIFSDHSNVTGLCPVTARQTRMANILGIQQLNERLAEESMALAAEAEAITLTQERATSYMTSTECADNMAAAAAAVAAITGENVNDPLNGSDNLAEAIKLAVNQKLNLQLEEELRTLKEEHSVLKDMVRDLEQLKENEEKQIQLAVDADGVTVVTTTTTVKNANGKTASTVTSSVSGNSAVNIANAVNASPLELIAQTVTSTVCGANGGHQCCGDHSDLLPEHPSKMCHRYDGSCSCYYCTIFGHSDCNHGRTNETRDRLRKRLQTKDSVHSASWKVTPRRTKTMKPPNAASNNSSNSSSAADKAPANAASAAATASTGAAAATTGARAAPGPAPLTISYSNNIPRLSLERFPGNGSSSTGASTDLATMLAAIDYEHATTTAPVAASGSAATAAAAKGATSSQRINNSQRMSVTTSTTRTYTARGTELLGHKCSAHKPDAQSAPVVAGEATATTGAGAATAPTAAATCGGVKRKLHPPVAQHTQNVLVNGGSAVAQSPPCAKKEVGICSLKDDQYRIKKILTKKAALAKAQQCAAKLTVPTAAAVAAAAGCTAANAATATTRGSTAAASGPSAKVASNCAAAVSASASIATKNHPTTVTFPPPPPVEPEAECVAERSIKSLLEYIEGGGSGSATARRELQKKAAKKAKQKQKRLADKQLEELELLRTAFHDMFNREAEAKLELKELKAAGAKKRDKRRIVEVEATVKRLGKLRQQHEADILERIADQKAVNSEFKFAYLPTKEQLLQHERDKELAKKICEELMTNKAQPTVRMTRPPAASDETPSSPAKRPVAPVEAPPVPEPDDDDDSGGDSSSDAAKRMVTIRRVIVPNADQQVTVTAKGPSPDKDKLLYTFVNGQMVAERRESAAATVMPVNMAEVYHQQHEELRQLNARRNLNAHHISSGGIPAASAEMLDAPNVTAKAKPSAPTDCTEAKSSELPEEPKSKVPLAKVKPVQLTGKAKKKAEKKARKAEAAAKSAAYREQQQLQQDSVDDISSVGTGSTASKLGTSNSKHPLPPTTKSSKSQRASAQQSARDKSEDEAVEQLTAKTQKLRLKMENAKAKTQKDQQKRKIKAARVEYADPQYRNNKFDVLDLDDDDYYVSESESEQSDHSYGRQARSDDKSALSKVLPLSPIEYPREVAFTTVRGSKGDKSKTKNSTVTAAAASAVVPKPPKPASPLPPATSVAAATSRGPAKRHQQQPPSSSAASPAVPAYMQTAAYARPMSMPQPLEIQLSKKQKKKLAQQQNRLANSTAAASASTQKHPQPLAAPTAAPTTATITSSFVQPTETMAQKLKNSMQRLSINDDTTIELVREHAHQARMLQQQHQVQLQQHQQQLLQQQQQLFGAAGSGAVANVSIIDQLQRGVQMEGLMLPPGITLTRVDPEHAEQIRVKKESIQNICLPLQSVDTMPAPPAHLLIPGAAHHQHAYASPATGQPDASGIIMVDTGMLQQQQQLPTLQDASSKKNKKNRRRKHKKDKEDVSNGPVATATAAGHGLITLRNPMFHPQMQQQQQQQQQQNGAAGLAMPPGLGSAPGPALPLSIDTPASITKNANGMFTIRNPAMHQAMQHSGLIKQPPQPSPMVNITAQSAPVASASSSPFQPLSAYLQPPPMMPPMSVPPPNMAFNTPPPPTAPTNLAQENFSFFSDHHTLAAMQTQHSQSSLTPSAPPVDTTSPAHNSHLATPTLPIGSEIKSAIHRKQMAWQSGNIVANSGGGGGSGNNSTASASASAGDLFGQLNSFGSNSVGHFNSDFVSGSSAASHAPTGLSGSQSGRQSSSSSSRYFGDANGNGGGAGIYGGGAIGTYGSDSSALGSGGFDANSLFGTSNGIGMGVGSMSSASSTSAASATHQHLHPDHRQSPPVAVGNTIGNYFNRPSLAQQLAAQQQQQQQQQHLQQQQRPQNYSYLGNLQPGQRLNSEVTIHNVNESKFNRNDATSGSLANNGVEITRIGPPVVDQNSHLQQQLPQNHNLQHQQHQSPHRQTNIGMHGHGQHQELQQQQQQHNSLFSQQFGEASGGPSLPGLASSSSLFKSGDSSNNTVLSGLPYGLNHSQTDHGNSNYMSNEFADSSGLFTPNQQLSLNDLESEEREIETFKRFNYYFKPPTTKPKVNFDVKNFMIANNRKTSTGSGAVGGSGTTVSSSDSSSSPYYSETTSLNGRTPSMDDLFHDMRLLKLGAQLNGGVSVEELGMLAGNSAGMAVGGASAASAMSPGLGAGIIGAGAVGSMGAGGGLIGGGNASSGGSVGSRSDSWHGLLDGSELKSGLVD